ncbi:MAG: D-alanine--D-alanine ligase [Phycisphaerales bacterium]|nr:MAG: D-alanine--D-alanine ligase [Phycisphaerales bacterium]
MVESALWSGAGGTGDLVTAECMDITVLAGGPGVEREVSLESGRAVHAALARQGHRVSLCDVSPDELSALRRPADFVFIALHGEFGEDGTVQRLLDDLGVPYCGSGAAASALAFDKLRSKEIFARNGLPTPEFRSVQRGTPRAEWGDLPLPCMVKPVASGSSVDVIRADTHDEAAAAIDRVLAHTGRALIERYVQGVELTVGILGDQALPVIEIRTRRPFYDYQAKYVDDDTQYLFDIDLPAELSAHVQALSLRAHRHLGCRAFSRADWLVDRRTFQPYLLEINTIPGFTGHSLLPKAAARVGIDFDTLCVKIVELSLSERSPVRVLSMAPVG